MFRSQQRKTKILFGLSDVFLTAAAFEIAYRFRQSLNLDNNFFLEADVHTLLLCFSVFTCVAAGYWLNVYTNPDGTDIRVILRDATRQTFYSAIAQLLFIYFGLHIEISRVFLTLYFAGTWTFLILFRAAARNTIPLVHRQFGLKRYILIAGLGPRAEHLGRSLEDYYDRGIRIAGFLAPPSATDTPESVSLRDTYPVFPISGLRSMLARHVIDEVHFAVDSGELPALEEVFLWCDEEGVCTRVAVDFFPHVNSSLALERLGTTPMLTFSAAPDDEFLLFAKRSIDIVLSIAGLVLLSPLLLITAILIRATSKGPIVFRQTRCGLNGRTFTCYKFRSMVVDAEERLADVAHLNTREIVTKIPNDPRLTPIGKWLRKFSIDELPQLVNVLRGDMSLVGPRPAIPSEVARYQRWQRRRLRMRPGLTCLWALEGRDKVDFEAWMRLDLEYIDSWSLGLDARIILRTIPEVLSGRGAS